MTGLRMVGVMWSWALFLAVCVLGSAGCETREGTSVPKGGRMADFAERGWSEGNGKDSKEEHPHPSLPPEEAGAGKRRTSGNRHAPSKAVEAAANHVPTAEDLRLGSRHEFGLKLARLKQGMTVGEVIGILGEPDDVQLEEDFSEGTLTHVSRVLCYGCERHMGFATLGTVMFDGEGKVIDRLGVGWWDYGFSPWLQREPDLRRSDMLVERLGEARLRKVLSTLGDLPSGWMGWDSGPMIRAINAVQPLGKETGGMVLREFMALDWDRNRGDVLIYMIRGLFTPKKYLVTKEAVDAWGRKKSSGYFEEPVNAYWGWEPKSREGMPSSPLVIVNGIPVVLIVGISTSFGATITENHLKMLEEEGDWREGLLRPTDDPLSVIPEVAGMVKEQHQRQARATVAQKVFGLLKTAYVPAVMPYENPGLSEEDNARIMARIRADLKRIKVRWDEARECYVRGDGSVLAEMVMPRLRMGDEGEEWGYYRREEKEGNF